MVCKSVVLTCGGNGKRSLEDEKSYAENWEKNEKKEINFFDTSGILVDGATQ